MKFDVFVSFRGNDIRRAFVSHLLLSLSKKQITIYKDEVEIPRYQSVYSRVHQAIEKSKIAIVVISKNYVASSWCLEELAMIIECKENGSLEVVPVFYEVDPSNVLTELDDRDNNLETMKQWRALEKLIEIYHQKYSYWEDEDSYSYVIDQVLIHVSHLLETQIEEETELEYLPPKPDEKKSDEKKPQRKPAEPKPLEYFPVDSEMPNTFLLIVQCLCAIITKVIKLFAAPLRTIIGRFMYGEESSEPRPPVRLLDVQNENYVIGNNLSRLVLSNDFNSFVGMDRLMKEVKTLLDLESMEESLEIGMYGERGVGKTTLARCVYEEFSPQFQDHHFFTNETTKCYPGACLLDNIARTSLTEQSESFQEFVKVMLGHRKVLLIVDNISIGREPKNIRNIVRWFGPGSRLILVTHHKHLLHGIERHYVVEPLRYDEALQLFSRSAFKLEQIPREYYQLAVRAVTITGRIPLSLKVFGTFLCGKAPKEWKKELCRLETPESRWDCVAKVSTYIGRALS